VTKPIAGKQWMIEIHDAALEARIQRLLQATGSRSVEEVLFRLVETQERIGGFWKTGIQLTQRLEPIPINSTVAKEFRKINWMLI